MDNRLASALRDRYSVERELGAGGMATVWLAHDLKHDRQVAIKVLHPHLAALVGAERFLKEIRTTAQLQHPHILPLFDSGDVEGLLYYVMPYVDGESLHERITRETRLPVSVAVRIAAEVASALDYAHRHGVIHRDIKPGNILLHDGGALVADFGIALAPMRSGDHRMTETGISLGTPTYMSPEQALGERSLDARSDVYSVGALLYEMLTGEPPFTGESAQAIVAKAITAKPVRPSRVRKDVPAYVDDAVLTALEKDPAHRFASAAALQLALDPSGKTRIRRRVSTRTAVPAILMAFLLLAGGFYYATHRAAAGVPPAALSIAALPFQIQDSADAYLGDQIPAEILDALTHVPTLTVRPLAAAPRFRNGRDLGAIARELAVSTLLTGSIGHEGKAIRVTARLYDVARNQNMPAVSFTNSATNKFALEDSVSSSIALSFKLSQSQSATAAQLAVAREGRTAIPAAHDTLMLARFYAEQRTPLGLTNAIALFRASIRLDSSYADAWAGLAYALSLRAVFGDSAPSLYFPAAKSSVLQALRLDSTSAEAHATYGLIKVFYDRDFTGAGPEFSKAMALDSTQSSAWLFRGWYYVSVNHLDSALLSVRHAWRIDPASLIAGTRLGDVLVLADSMEGAERQLLSVLKVDGDFRFARAKLALTYADDHQCSKALQVLPVYRWPSGAAEESSAPYVWARCSQPERAREFIKAEEARARAGQYVNAFFVATVCAALNDRACVYSWLNRAIENHDWALYIMRYLRPFAPYRAEPAFQELERRAGLP